MLVAYCISWGLVGDGLVVGAVAGVEQQQIQGTSMTAGTALQNWTCRMVTAGNLGCADLDLLVMVWCWSSRSSRAGAGSLCQL